ncbi:4-methylaminobutanoate oxidase (formaldehyde-forming) [Nocardioides ginsengisegetis]|uniref:4-methylaminobutanoate oxidase (Formaldehyde-forming) n=1 Tax=Nocardioides ginsengisegetis TaxID=661491 RepID=A0A7W3P9F4_9ACTN|nr:4-methylaminobutanoate oxidase (formaldehyde-forming) [Nocardioides ginsengisegetis]
MTTDLPARARVVVVGGGVIGTSVAYHLTKLGWTDVLLLEQGTLSCGTTWHAAGLVGPLRASESGTRLVQYSAELYARLEAETGLATGYRNVGGVIVARTEDRMVQLRRTAANAAAYDMECELLTPAQARDLWPVMAVDDLLGAIWLPGDGKVNPTDLTQSLAKGARQGGARIVERVRVTGYTVAGSGAGRRVTGVRTDRGDVEAEVVVTCAGQWSKALGDRAGVTVPLHSAEHFYVVTEAVDGVHPDLPIMRDPDGFTYFKEEVGGLVVGGFEPEAKPWRSPDTIPHPFEFQLLEEDWEHFSVLMDEALVRIPALAETGIRKFYNGPESFTPDNQFLLGETPGLRGHFVGAGFNSVGIASAGGAGRALAEWIVEGEATTDLVGVDVRRFAPFNANNRWLRDRVAEVLGLHYAVPWPNRELETARPFRCSPVHDRLAARGAVFGSRMGWERPNVFAPSPAEPRLHYAWGKQSWLPWSAAEQRATRQDVAVFDQTSFSKYVVSGPGSLAWLQWVCANDVDVEPGRVVYTPWLNARGTYEADLTVTRVAADEFLLVSSSATTVRDLDWLERHRPDGVTATVRDVTSAHAVLGVMGPRSREVLQALTDSALGEEAFLFATSRELFLGHATVRATRMTYVGELGWELLVPMELTTGVYDLLRAADVADAGYYTIESLRLEKGYRAFGRELTPDFGPVEAGLVFATALDRDKDFLGRSALAAHREALRAPGPRRRLVSFVLEDPEPMLWGGELVLLDGRPVGQVTSAAWGETVGACVGLAYLRRDEAVTADWLAAGGFQVDVGGDQFGIRATLRAPL